MPKTDNIEIDKRIRAVQEWLVDDYPISDIIANCIQKWGIQDRQAKRYIKEARNRWAEKEHPKIEQKLSLRVESLKKLKRSLAEKFKGTPPGIFAQLAVEKEIIKLESLGAPIKIEQSGPNGGPIPTEVTHRVIFEDNGSD